jgi:hypothetical protein
MKTTVKEFTKRFATKEVTVYVQSYDDYPHHGFSVRGVCEGFRSPKYKSWQFIQNHDARGFGQFETAEDAANAAFLKVFGSDAAKAA